MNRRTISIAWWHFFLFSSRSSEVKNVYEQELLITVYDSDRGEDSGVKNVLKEKRSVSQWVIFYSLNNKTFFSFKENFVEFKILLKPALSKTIFLVKFRSMFE